MAFSFQSAFHSLVRDWKFSREKMQAAKNAAASAKETAANVAASAKSGMDKTKATVQEKV